MNRLVALVIHYGVGLVALNVFLEQIGAPIPAVPTLIIAGALTRDGRLSSTQVMLGAVISSVVADWIWFALGRRFGYRILRLLCRISLSPDSCVRDTEANFERWGMKSLLVAKFVPGFSTVAPPLAGATKRSTVEFLIYDTAGSFIWAGVAVAAGRVFFRQIDRVLEKLENLGWWAVAIVGLIFALIVFVKWWQRMRFMKELRVARIQPHELKEMFDRGDEPVVVDVRTSAVRKRDPRRIPNAIVADSDDIPPSLERVPPHTAIVLYCT